MLFILNNISLWARYSKLFRNGFPHFQATIFKIFTEGLAYFVNVKYLFFRVWRLLYLLHCEMGNDKYLLSAAPSSVGFSGKQEWSSFFFLRCVFTPLVSLRATDVFLSPRRIPFRFPCSNRNDLCADGELRFASYYGDHMVLQKSPERAVLWGYGPRGVVVTVSLSGPTQQQRSAEAAKDGEWTDETQRTVKANFNCTEFLLTDVKIHGQLLQRLDCSCCQV